MAEKGIVHIVDDELPIRRSIAFVLQGLGYLPETWASGAEFIQHVERSQRACVILDLHMPDIGGLGIQEWMNEHGILLPVIILTGQGDIQTAVRAIQNGAVDFLEKPVSRHALLGVIEQAFERLDDISTQVERREQALRRLKVLTHREREILDRLAKGHSNKEIALMFGISPRTVEVHRANIMFKLRVTSFPDALRLAFLSELGETDEDGEPMRSPHVPPPE